MTVAWLPVARIGGRSAPPRVDPRQAATAPAARHRPSIRKRAVVIAAPSH